MQLPSPIIDPAGGFSFERAIGGVPGLVWLAAGVAVAVVGLMMRRVLRLRREERSRHRLIVQDFRGARRDGLTGLQTREAYAENLARRTTERGGFGHVVIDIDRFALFNATEGYRAGDEVLRVLAERLTHVARDRDLVGRLGDDEFGLILELEPGSSFAESAVLAVRQGLRDPVPAAGRLFDVEISIGMALAPAAAQRMDRAEASPGAESLMQAAELAIGRVKADGGGSWRVFDQAQALEQRSRATLQDELRTAVANGEFVPYYQPIVELATGSIVGLEVLARWQNPVRGLMGADSFIPLAEEMQLAGAISRCLLRRVVRDAGDWPDSFYFAFNASPSQLRDLVELVHAPPVWLEGVLDPRRIEVEITESALIQDLDVARDVIATLQARGTRVVLDDFGNGYSNFIHLRELPFDRLKIDRGFVTDMATHKRSEACVRAMVALGRSLSVDIVAEGIESVEVATILAGLGCRFGQGYLFSAPVAANGVPALLRRSPRRLAEEALT